jgi:acetolactate synthase-1/2/3 large subunit
MKVSDFVIEYFKRNEVDTCFTISGGGCIHLIDSLRKSKLQTICPHHEQSVLMASEGYYRQSGKMSLNIVTTGPGGTNTLTGLLGMWLDSIPSVIISGQVPLNQISRGTGCRQIGDQEFDIISCVKNMTKYSVMIENPQDIIHEVKKAHALAKTGRPGPTWIDIPLDIQGADIKVSEGSFIPYNKLSKKAKNYIALEKLLEESKKPLIIVGNGVRLSNTYDKLDHFLKKTNIPVVTGPHSGVDVVDNTLKNYCGRIGILGQLTSNQIVQECDLILCLGSRLPVKMTGYNIPEFSPKSKKVIVDVDVSEIRKHKFDVELSYQSDLNDFFDNIKVPQMEISDWINETQKIRESQEYVHRKHENLKSHTSFYNLINQAPDVFGDTPIVTSNGTAHVVTLQMYRLNKNQRLFTNVGCASMGFGLPAAIGACVGNDRKDVICIEGDGSLMMNLQELETVVSQKLPIKLMIINNDGYLSIKMTQESFFSGQEFASGPETGVTIPSYEKVAKAFGIPYLKMTKNDNIKNELKEMMSIDGPCIMEIFTHPNEKHEPKVMHKGVGEDGKIIPGSLTDMQIADTI